MLKRSSRTVMAPAVGYIGEEERDDGVAGQDQGEEESRLRFGKTQTREVEDQHYGQRAKGEEACEAGGEQEPRVAGQGHLN
jgi:hypothetical protein